ncbi:MAG: PAS domain-containing protein [Caulobacterales bacterium]|nr:PAS domain-containing protein [Caulobacterales bacterium]
MARSLRSDPRSTPARPAPLTAHADRLKTMRERRGETPALPVDAERVAALEWAAQAGSWSLDLHTQDLAWSPEMYRIHGVTPQTFTPTVSAALDFLHPDDRTSAAECLRRAVHQHEPFDLEARILRDDGEEREVRLRAGPLADEPREIRGVCCDLTDLRRAEEALRAHEELFHAILDAAGVGLFNVSEEPGSAGYWSPALYQLTGLRAGDVAPTWASLISLVHPDDAALATLVLLGHADGPDATVAEFRLRHRTRDYRLVRGAVIAAHRDKDGTRRLIGFVQGVRGLRIPSP